MKIGEAHRSAVMHKYWQNGQFATERYKARVAELVRPGMKLLHAGCGWDKNEVSSPFRETCEIVGVDLDPRVAEMFHSEFHHASLAEMPFLEDARFDLIFSEYVLEHLTEPARVFAELSRVLKPGGRILHLTPNGHSYKSLAAKVTPQAFHLAMGRIRYGAGHEADMYETHYRCNTAKRLDALAAACGMRVVKIEYLSNGPTWFRKFPVVFEVFHGAHLVMARFDALKRMRCSLLVELQKDQRDASAAPANSNATAGA